MRLDPCNTKHTRIRTHTHTDIQKETDRQTHQDYSRFRKTLPRVPRRWLTDRRWWRRQWSRATRNQLRWLSFFVFFVFFYFLFFSSGSRHNSRSVNWRSRKMRMIEKKFPPVAVAAAAELQWSLLYEVEDDEQEMRDGHCQSVGQWRDGHWYQKIKRQ